MAYHSSVSKCGSVCGPRVRSCVVSSEMKMIAVLTGVLAVQSEIHRSCAGCQGRQLFQTCV